MTTVGVDAACATVTAHLDRALPAGRWSVSRYPDAADTAPHSRADTVTVPVRTSAGVLLGTITGRGPRLRESDLQRHEPMLGVLADLLAQVFLADLVCGRAERSEAVAQRRGMHDRLTDLPNRAAFLGRLDAAMDSAAHPVTEAAAGRPVAVLLFDLDDFTLVNELLGFQAGDQLLVAMAARLRGVLQDRYLVARVGDDEFAVLVDDGRDPVELGERVLNRMQAPFQLRHGQVSLRASLGVAEWAVPAGRSREDAQTLLAHSHVAVSVAKRDGKARLARFEPGPAAPDGRHLTLREPLRVAVVTGALELQYEPVISLRGHEVSLLEARPRWTHGGEEVPAAVVLQVAASSGLLATLTDQVLELVCGQLARWDGELGHRRLQVGVDVPAEVLTDPEFPDRVAACLARHGVAARQLVVQLTEESLLRDIDAAAAVLRRLRELGCVLALGDFGTGSSSLLHLQRITLDSLRIDRRFVTDLDTDPAAERLLSALLALGRSMGLKVIVEGIDRPGQAEALRRLGCQHAQGPLFAQPAPAAELRWLLTPAPAR